jgi:hypothetical protein
MVIGDGVLTPAISGNNHISSLFLHNVLQVASFIPRST